MATPARKWWPTAKPVPRGGGQYLIGRPYRVAGHTYVPSENASYSAVGMASWYGAAFHGRRTANGEVYDMASLTAAHPTMPLPSYARVTNLKNGYSVIVRVNDRGPIPGGRVMDVSSRTADVLGFKGEGTARIKVDYVGRAPLEGSDDSTLLASLRTDGSPANLNGYSEPVMVASNASARSARIRRPSGCGRTASRRPRRSGAASRRACSGVRARIFPEPSNTPPAAIAIRRTCASFRPAAAASLRSSATHPEHASLMRGRRSGANHVSGNAAATPCSSRRAGKGALLRRPISAVRRSKSQPRGAFDRVKPAEGRCNDD